MKFSILKNIGLVELLNNTTISNDGKCVFINTESTDNMCGIKIPLQTKAGNFYTIILKGRVLSGEKVSFFCVSNSPLINESYFLTSIDKEITIVFQAIDANTIIGLIPIKKYISHKIQIDTLTCTTNSTNMNNKTSLGKKQPTFIKKTNNILQTKNTSYDSFNSMMDNNTNYRKPMNNSRNGSSLITRNNLINKSVDNKVKINKNKHQDSDVVSIKQKLNKQPKLNVNKMATKKSMQNKPHIIEDDDENEIEIIMDKKTLRSKLMNINQDQNKNFNKHKDKNEDKNENKNEEKDKNEYNDDDSINIDNDLINNQSKTSKILADYDLAGIIIRLKNHVLKNF